MDSSFSKNENSVINYSPSCCSKPVRPSFVFGTQIKIFLMKSESFLTLYRQQRSYYGQGTERNQGLKKKKKSKSVHSEQNRYFNVSVPAFLCIITVPKPVRVEKITVNNVISFKIVFAYDDNNNNNNKVQSFLYTKRKQEEMVS